MSNNICLVGLVGRNVEWINRSIYEIKPSVVVLIASTDEDKYPNRKKFPEDKYPRVTYLDYAYFIRDFTYKFYEQMAMQPPEIKIVPVENSRDLSAFFTILKTIISHYLDNDYEIYINISAGLLAWQLASYYVAMMFDIEKIKVFFYDKELGRKILFPTFTLTKTEQQILNIIAEGYTKPGDILKEYIKRVKKQKKVTPAMISKYLGELKRKGLVKSEGREYMLTDLGKLLSDRTEIKKKIRAMLIEYKKKSS